MKSPNETNVGLNGTDPVNAIIDHRLPKRWHKFGLRDIEDAWPEAQRAAIFRFCEAVEKQADRNSAKEDDHCLADSYWYVKEQLIAARHGPCPPIYDST